MPDWMPSWGTTALITIVISLLTLIVSGRYISPLLEVRNRRFQTKMQAREKFQANMLDLLSAVTHLLAAPVVPEATDTVRTALREERTRWRAQVDETTKYLTDHAVQLLFAYRGPQLPDLAVRYSSNARGVWISDRTEEQKLTALQNVTQHCHTLFFDSPVYARQRIRSWTELERLLSEMEAPARPVTSSPPPSAPPTAP
ncbi:hypothetical protein [Streptomyces sp. AMCC400023]|uniref:hypothetical protein n=1 Tax=Streptomyces sp. AMCC400023 TaxID=2056258 RepID=UPI001F468320|nr:hypothetical protein [Streptomyces sp. AMCC400023]UJV47319.1 hypothetical protein CVT30_46850 [Streptomyces sp. AMCC400023]UJV47351.1 hypothetical protein CVT30_47015 [Streptomyces sp. AMCC400023]